MDSINNIIKRLRENRILQERADYSKYSRNELIKLAKDGDQLAVDTLIKSHQGFIKNMSSKYFLSTGDKDDVEQVATIAFWTAIQDWDMTGDFEAFAGRRIKSRLSDEISKESAGKSQINTLANSIDDTINSDGEGGEQTLGDTIPAKTDSPEDIASAKELQQFIEKYLEDEFTPEEREVINKSIEGYKTKEIAEVLGMPYKKVDNILYKIKYKLREYIRNNYDEAKKIRREKDIEFSDEEKKILESALHNIKVREDRKMRASRLKESYENYTEDQLDDEMDDIDEELDDIIDSLKDTRYEERSDLLDELEEKKIKLMAFEEYLTDEQYKRYEELMDKANKAEDTEYEGPSYQVDPYAERGLNRSDFY